MARILTTGIATLDHTLDVERYPREDDEIRALASSSQPGGNATNTARILAQFGHRAALAAVFAEDGSGDWLRERLEASGVDTGACVRHPGATPTSHILRSRDSGSRTIVHHRDLPELSAADLRRIAWEEYDWLHFEGRQPETLREILPRVREAVTDQPISLELEKRRPGLEACLEWADVLMLSRDWAQGIAARPDEAAAELARRYPGRIVTVTAGAEGAWLAQDELQVYCAPTPGLRVVDSVGAGDTFNAGLINALVSGEPPEQALVAAVRLAECKLQQAGFDGLAAAAVARP
ncbi:MULTISPECIES: carbohydrate kinase family protein [unclassified Thioalkalivibrio]|uniref:carbohydrate kinase family protein n=1 Tax=unclassified Thioalkalivibrio TaxID=2621013 RepID=UPI000366CA6C|nr:MULTISPECIES: PfkB family carbohydrate kinase [unclassified Thioalkalivibrio]